MLWKCATRNSVLCTRKSSGGIARMMPVMPPITKVIMNAMEYSMGTVNRTSPRNMVQIQS